MRTLRIGIYLALILNLFSIDCQAKGDTTYLNNDLKTCPKTQATYFRLIIISDSTLTCVEYYIRNNRVRRIASCISATPLILNGKTTSFDTAGNKTSEGAFFNNVRIGKWTWFKPNGKVSETEEYLSMEQRNNKLCVKIAPMGFIDTYNGPALRLGVEYKLKNHFAAYQELGTFFPVTFQGEHNKGIITRMELKYYINKENLTSEEYFSAELFFKNQTYTTWDTIAISPQAYYGKSYSVNKNVASLTFKYGVLIVKKNRFVMDYFVGLGFRFKITSNTLSDLENNHIKSVGDYGDNITLNRAGQYILPDVVFGIRIGYRIR